MWKCPECKAKLEYLKYNVSTQSCEYGTADLINDPTETQLEQRRRYDIITDHNSDDYGNTDWDGNPEYECPDCSAEIEISDLEWCEDEEEDELDEEGEPIRTKVEDELEETKHKIIVPQQRITEKYTDNTFNNSIICKECKHVFVSNIGERWEEGSVDFCDCPKCGTQNSTEEFKKLLKDGFFNNNEIIIKKHVTTKKTKHSLIASMVKSGRKLRSAISRH